MTRQDGVWTMSKQSEVQSIDITPWRAQCYSFWIAIRLLVIMGLKQKTYNSRIVLLIVMGVTFVNGVTSSICDNGVCNCSPRYREFTTIDCKCNAVKKVNELNKYDTLIVN